MTRQAARFSAQDGRTRGGIGCVRGRRRSWLRAALLASVALATAAHAQNATWLANPASGDFNTAGNWSANAVPTGTATFNASSQRIVGFSQDTALGSISLTAGAGAYTFNNNGNNLIQLGGGGLNVANGASVTVNNTSNGRFFFVNASAVGNVVLNNSGGGELLFQDNSSAGTARITNSSGMLIFFRGASAGTAHIINNDQLQFVGFGSSTAADATIENHGSVSFIGVDGVGAIAGNASITSDGSIFFSQVSSGGTARINMTGGSLDISGLTTGGTTLGLLEGKGNVFLGGNFLRIGGSNLSTIFAGVIQDGGGTPGGHGIIQKEGTGVWTLTGQNTYTGATTVTGGALVVDGSIASSSGVTVGAGATLGGTGTVASTTIQDRGTLVSGHTAAPFGALTVQGNLVFTAAATFMVQVAPSATGRTDVTGNATLGGATVQASFASGTFVTRQNTILHADGGLGGTTFGTLVTANLPAFFVASLSYDANNVFLNLRALAPQFMPGNVNQRNVAGGIINSFNTVGGLPAEFMTVTPAGLTQLSGETAVGSQQATFDAMHQFMGVMLDPTIGGRGAPVTGGAYGSMPRKAPLADIYGARWSLWAAGYGGSQTISGDAVLGSNKTTSNVFGGAVGADYHVSPNTVAGVALAGGGTNFRVANGGHGESDLFQAGAYFRHTQGAVFLAAALAYGRQDVTTNRTITVDGIDSLRGHFHANAFSGRLESGFRIATQSIDLTPYAAGQFISYRLPSYAEQAASSPFALAYDGKTATAARTEIGVKTEKAVMLSDAQLMLRSRLAWAHELDRDRSLSAEFPALPASAFVVNGARPAADSALATLSAELTWHNGWSAGATFDSQLSDTTRSYAGKGTIRYAW
jgi:autotransporter-associated beta strand protein